MRGVVAGAAYLPGYTDGRHRRVGPDEDAFTLAATAIERAASRPPTDPRTHVVRVVGPEAARDPSLLASLLGVPVDVEAVPSRTLDDALAHAATGSGPEWIVVVSLSDRSGSSTDETSDGAVAFRIDEAPDALSLAAVGAAVGSSPTRTPFEALLALGRGAAAERRWPGEWSTELPAGRPLPRSPQPRTEPAPVTVSEGALVPGPREEEGRPSRWRFLADRCGACGTTTFPSRGRCRSCGRSDGLAAVPIPFDGGRVVAVTWIGAGGQPTEFDGWVAAGGPYGVALVDLGDSVRATLPVADATAQEIPIGTRVETRLRRLYPMEGRWRYGRKAVPSPAPRAGA